MLGSDYKTKDGVTRFVTRIENGSWVALQVKDGQTIKKKHCLNFPDASTARGVLINEFWSNSLN